MTTIYACIGATFRRVHIVGASPFGIKVLIEEPIERGDPVTIAHRRRAPIEGRVTWVKENMARIEFAEPLSTELFQEWFQDVVD